MTFMAVSWVVPGGDPDAVKAWDENSPMLLHPYAGITRIRF
jgi:hypothetical protein